MSDHDIRPRRVGQDWICATECPQMADHDFVYLRCGIDGEARRHADAPKSQPPHLCPHHARRVAAERDRLRDAIRTALDESTTYDEVEARLIGLVEEE